MSGECQPPSIQILSLLPVVMALYNGTHIDNKIPENIENFFQMLYHVIEDKNAYKPFHKGFFSDKQLWQDGTLSTICTIVVQDIFAKNDAFVSIDLYILIISYVLQECNEVSITKKIFNMDCGWRFNNESFDCYR